MADQYSRKISIYIESGQAQVTYEKLRIEQERLVASVKKYVDAGKEVPEKITKNLLAVNEKLKTQSDIISGKLSPNLKELSSTYTQLNAELGRMRQEDAGFELKKKQVQEAKQALEGYKSTLTSVKEGFKDMLNQAKGIALGVIVGNTVTAVVEKIGGMFSGLISGAAKVSDELTDIAKTTNLSKEDVKALNSELSKMDTRTSTGSLRGLAEEAGKLGKESVEDVKRFVEEANMIKVALGEDLGEGAITQIGKVADIFQTSMTKIGSAINEIGAKSAATEAFQTDFLFRMAGIGKVAKISAADLLGFGATLDINGQQVEASSTALQSFFIDFTKNTEKFGKASGMVAGSLTNIANTKGVNAAFITFLENLKKGSASSDDMLRKLEALGIDGARGASTFLALANNIETVKQQQVIANQAFDEGTSIISEYDKKNNNFAATVEKIGKEWGKLTASSTVQEFLTSAGNATLLFLKALQLLPEWINKNSTLLIALAGAYVTYNASIIAANAQKAYEIVITNASIVAEKIKQGLLFTGRALLMLGTIAQLAFNGSITLGTAANMAFGTSLAFATGGLTLIVGALAAAGTAIAMYANSQRESLKVALMVADVHKQAALSVAEEKSTLEELLLIAKDETQSKEKRIEAIQKLNELSPEYLGNITLETINTNESTKAINAYLAALDKKAYAEAIHAERVKLNQKLVEEQNKSLEDNIMWYDYLGGTLKGIASVGIYSQDYEKTAASRQKGNISLIQKEISALNELEKARVKSDVKPFSMVNPPGTFSDTNLNLSGGSDKAADEKAKKAKADRDKDLSAFEQFYQKLLDLKKQSAAALISEDEKEIEAVRIKYEALERELAEFHKKGIIDVKRFQDTQKLLIEDYNNELERLNKKHFENRSENEYSATLYATQQYYDRLVEVQKDNQKKGLINDAEYNYITGQLQSQAIQAKITIAKDYKGTVEKAGKDEVKFQKSLYEQDLENFKTSEAFKKASKEKSFSSAIDTAKIKGDVEWETSLRLRQLDEQYANDMAYWSKKVEGEEQNQDVLNQITEKYTADRNAIISQSQAKGIESSLGYLQQVVGVFSSISQIMTNLENADLNRMKKAHTSRIKYYDDELKAKRLSKKEYDKLVDAANKEQAQKEDEIKKKQFERNKAMQIVSAVINTAAAIASAWGTSGNIYAAIAMSVVAAAAGAAQIGVIASQQYQGATYAEGTDSIAKGPSHAQGGIKMIDSLTGKQVGEMEGDEAIISKATTAANPSVIAKLIKAKGKPIAINEQRASENIRIFAQGVTSINPSIAAYAANKTNDAEDGFAVMQKLIATNTAMLDEMKKFNAKKLALSLQEINDGNKLLDYLTEQQL